MIKQTGVSKTAGVLDDAKNWLGQQADTFSKKWQEDQKFRGAVSAGLIGGGVGALALPGVLYKSPKWYHRTATGITSAASSAAVVLAVMAALQGGKQGGKSGLGDSAKNAVGHLIDGTRPSDVQWARLPGFMKTIYGGTEGPVGKAFRFIHNAYGDRQALWGPQKNERAGAWTKSLLSGGTSIATTIATTKVLNWANKRIHDLLAVSKYDKNIKNTLDKLVKQHKAVLTEIGNPDLILTPVKKKLKRVRARAEQMLRQQITAQHPEWSAERTKLLASLAKEKPKGSFIRRLAGLSAGILMNMAIGAFFGNPKDNYNTWLDHKLKLGRAK